MKFVEYRKKNALVCEVLLMNKWTFRMVGLMIILWFLFLT